MWNRDDVSRLLQPPLIGMIHLPALPGAPGWGGDLATVEGAAGEDLDALVAGGIRTVMVENYHDHPFHPGTVPPETIAAMTVLLAALRRRQPDVVFGVNVLRNDAAAALAIAGATGAAFIRVNVHAGTTVTDQGVITGDAHRTLRRRRELGFGAIGILADLRVKHAAPLAPRPLVEEANDLRLRGGADVLILTGVATGAAADPESLHDLRRRLPDCPLLVGSGVTTENAAAYAPHADGAIVGTSLKEGGAVSATRTQRLLAAWRGAASPRKELR